MIKFEKMSLLYITIKKLLKIFLFIKQIKPSLTIQYYFNFIVENTKNADARM